MQIFTRAYMRRSRRVFAIVLALTVLPWSSAFAAENSHRLTLAEASRRTLQQNPALQVFQWRMKVIDGQRETVDQAPAYRLGVEAENIGGSGEYNGVDRAELTLSLSSVIELGDQRRSRVVVADAHHAFVDAERQARSLDVLGQVTQRYIAALALQEKSGVADDAVTLADKSLQLVSRRVQQGAAPEVERLRAQAALTQARLRRSALDAESQSRRMSLAALWGGQQADFTELSGSLFQFNTRDDFETLYQRVENSPRITAFASEARLRDAELELARSQSSANVEWSLGVRHFDESGDSALTAGISVPLFSGSRNRGDIRAASAEREAVNSRRDSTLIALRARLFEAWQTHQQSVAAVQQIRADILPLLEQAQLQTREAYERGRYRYSDWVTAQQELLDARLAMIDAASTALLNQALIEQLTAQPLSVNPQ